MYVCVFTENLHQRQFLGGVEQVKIQFFTSLVISTM